MAAGNWVFHLADFVPKYLTRSDFQSRSGIGSSLHVVDFYSQFQFFLLLFPWPFLWPLTQRPEFDRVLTGPGRARRCHWVPVPWLGNPRHQKSSTMDFLQFPSPGSWWINFASESSRSASFSSSATRTFCFSFPTDKLTKSSMTDSSGSISDSISSVWVELLCG